jgi:hypothetical protein
MKSPWTPASSIHPARRIPSPRPQIACHDEWLKISVALRNALTFPWPPDAWREEMRRHRNALTLHVSHEVCP